MQWSALNDFWRSRSNEKASCDKRRKSIKYSIYDSSFWKSNYGYEHNSIWIDTEQNDFLLSLPTQEVVWLRRYNNIFYISKVWYFAYSIYVQRTNTQSSQQYCAQYGLAQNFLIVISVEWAYFDNIMHSTNKCFKPLNCCYCMKSAFYVFMREILVDCQ